MSQSPEHPTPTELTAREVLAESGLIGPIVEVDRPAFITERDWLILKWQVWDTHRAITELEAALKPALASITSGNFNIGSLLFGGKKK